MSYDDTGDGQRPLYTIWRDEPRREIDLSQFTTEAMLAEQLRADARKKGVPLRHYDPDFRPRHQKGAKLDKDSDEHRRAAEAAVRGLPLWSSISWLEVQLFDNGPAEGRHAHTRFVLKFCGTSAAAGALVNADRRALSVTRHCYLSAPKNFARNLKRKKAQHALSAAEWDVVNQMMEATASADTAEGQPATLIGALSCKLHGEGTCRSVGQFATLSWGMRDGEWRPQVILVQHDRREDRVDVGGLELGPPPVIKEGRKATACRWYARHESAEFTKLMERAKDPMAALRDRMSAMRRAA